MASKLSRRTLLSSGVAVAAGLVVTGARSLALVDLAEAGDRTAASAADESTELLIIGAGPFGLALAAYAQEHGIRSLTIGAPMGFWKSNMPRGMFLRSTCDWSLDPLDVHSIDAYLEKIGRKCRDVEPLSRDFYLDYADWFQVEKDLHSVDATVADLSRDGPELVAVTRSGRRIRSRFAVLAIGFRNFAYVPPELASKLPRDRCAHTCDLVEFEPLKDRRILVIGGRQSAFEWTALMREAGAESIDVCYRHDTPLFAESDFSWVKPIVERMPDDPGWYRRLSADEKAHLNQRFWQEGRLKLEPWLASRIEHRNVRLHPRTQLAGAETRASGIDVVLDDGKVLRVDQVVFATGYEVAMIRVPFLTRELLSELEIEEGFPVLDEHFQTSVPGLYCDEPVRHPGLRLVHGVHGLRPCSGQNHR